MFRESRKENGMTYTFTPKGVCSRKIDFEIEEQDGKKVVKSVNFTGGCAGNTQGVSRLIEGMEVNDAIGRISGIKCGMKGTSCPDQLSLALKEALAQDA